MRPAGVLFDFDGVIVHSLPLHLEAWVWAYAELFGKQLDEAITATLMGRSTKSISELLAKAEGRLEKAPALAELKRERLRLNRKPVPLVAGVRELLSELRKQAIPFAIASNAPREFIRQTLASHGLEFEHFLGIEDYTKAKPSPEPYLLAAKRVGIPLTLHGKTYVFEDSVHGLKAAVGAGMIPIGVMTQHDEALLKSGGAKLVCSDMTQVLEWKWLEAIPTL